LVTLTNSVAMRLPSRSLADWMGEFCGTAKPSDTGARSLGIDQFAHFVHVGAVFQHVVVAGNAAIEYSIHHVARDFLRAQSTISSSSSSTDG
jgi:hypothetical protein